MLIRALLCGANKGCWSQHLQSTPTGSYEEIFIVCPPSLPRNPMVADLNPRGVSPPGYRGRTLCQQLSRGILATYPSRWTAATEWISKSRGSINISPDLLKSLKWPRACQTFGRMLTSEQRVSSGATSMSGRTTSPIWPVLPLH